MWYLIVVFTHGTIVFKSNALKAHGKHELIHPRLAISVPFEIPPWFDRFSITTSNHEQLATNISHYIILDHHELATNN